MFGYAWYVYFGAGVLFTMFILPHIMSIVYGIISPKQAQPPQRNAGM